MYGADAISLSRVPLMLRFIPVCTGQMDKFVAEGMCAEVHPRVHGANTKSLGEVSMLGKPLFPFALDFRNRTSMYHFRQSYFCG